MTVYEFARTDATRARAGAGAFCTCVLAQFINCLIGRVGDGASCVDLWSELTAWQVIVGQHYADAGSTAQNVYVHEVA